MEYYEPNIKVNPDKLQFWSNPVDEKVYAMYGRPEHGFDEAGLGSYAVYDLGIRANNKDLMKTGKADEIEKSPWLGEWYNRYQEWWSLYEDPVTRMAAQTSSDHTAIEVLNVHAEVFGRREREFAGRNLAQTINVPQLVIDIDTLKKFGNVEKPNKRGHFKMKLASFSNG